MASRKKIWVRYDTITLGALEGTFEEAIKTLNDEHAAVRQAYPDCEVRLQAGTSSWNDDTILEVQVRRWETDEELANREQYETRMRENRRATYEAMKKEFGD